MGSDVTQAYVNHGRWIADCNRPYCMNAERLQPRQGEFYCSNCRWTGTVLWPDEADDITRVLDRRPVPQTRNWFPTGHELALRAGCPNGQSVADLLAENAEHEVPGGAKL